MVVDTARTMAASIDPQSFDPHSIAILGVVILYESLITFLFVHLSVSARSLTYLIVKALTPFRPASGIDVQSLPCGLRCQPNNKAVGISPTRS